MSNFKEFFEKSNLENSTALSIPSPNTLAITLKSGILASSSSFAKISDEDATEFGHKVSELVTSDELINELSDEIGVPASHETEDEFVKRAKLTLRKILKEKLSK